MANISYLLDTVGNNSKNTLGLISKVFKALTSAAYHADRCEGDEIDVVTGLVADAQDLVGNLEDAIYDDIASAAKDSENISILSSLLDNIISDMKLNFYILKDIEPWEIEHWADAHGMVVSVSRVREDCVAFVPESAALQFKLRWHDKCQG